MTNEELKQEAIKNAYGEYWEKVKNHLDEDGWVSRDSIIMDSASNFDFRSYLTSNDAIRPKSLAGIENNNGWIRIEEDGSNLPNHLLWLSDLRTIWQGCFFIDFDNKNIRINTAATHYQSITKPELPLY